MITLDSGLLFWATLYTKWRMVYAFVNSAMEARDVGNMTGN